MLRPELKIDAFSDPVFLISERSKLTVPGVRTSGSARPTLPNVKFGGLTKDIRVEPALRRLDCRASRSGRSNWAGSPESCLRRE